MYHVSITEKMNSYVELFLDCLAWSELIFLSERYELICELDQYEKLIQYIEAGAIYSSLSGGLSMVS